MIIIYGLISGVLIALGFINQWADHVIAGLLVMIIAHLYSIWVAIDKKK